MFSPYVTGAAVVLRINLLGCVAKCDARNIGGANRRLSIRMEHVTILGRKDEGGPSRGFSSGFPLDLLRQSANRLRMLAVL
jgi:hypothetical protein